MGQGLGSRTPTLPGRRPGCHDGAVSSEGEPAPSKPPRSALTVRDMLVALAALLAARAGDRPLIGRGTEGVGGLRWVIYDSDGGEPVWIAELPGPTPLRALITGSGAVDDFRALAGALARA